MKLINNHRLSKSLRKLKKKFRKSIKNAPKMSLPILMLALALVFFGCGRLIYVSDLQTSVKTTNTKQQTVTNVSDSQTQTNNLFLAHPSWGQNFESSTDSKLSSKYWNIYQGPPQNSNHESEYYSNNKANIRIQNGSLILEATKGNEPYGYKYGSALINTQNKQSFLYGRIDIVAKVPDGVGTWPAVWLLPANSKYENLDPLSDPTRYLNGGEIDMIEEVGFQPNLNYGIVHTLSTAINLGGVGLYNTVYIPNNDTNYNLYSILWTPTSITFEVNNQPFYIYNKQIGADFTTWPFNQPFYLIINLALGGTWGGQDTSQFSSNGIDNSIFPTSMNIQSIYYYPYIGTHK